MYKIKQNYIKLLIIIVILLSAIIAVFFVIRDLIIIKGAKDAEVGENTKEAEDAEGTKDAGVAEVAKEEVEIKSSVNLDVPFTSQAPYAVWDELHNEACEEAVVLMAYQYGQNGRRDKIPSSEADQKIKEMVNWQIQKLGVHKDLTAYEVVNYLAKEYLGLNKAEVKDFSIEGIKKELSAGKPVIVPSAGRLLKNPNFKRPGPIYHMVVIVGYDEKNFVTNDPGTRNGYKYKYTFDRILNAAHNWAGSEGNIETGQRVYIVLN